MVAARKPFATCNRTSKFDVTLFGPSPMPILEDLFLRLSRLARRVPSLPPGELPPGLANRVLAQVRAFRARARVRKALTALQG